VRDRGMSWEEGGSGRRGGVVVERYQLNGLREVRCVPMLRESCAALWSQGVDRDGSWKKDENGQAKYPKFTGRQAFNKRPGFHL